MIGRKDRAVEDNDHLVFSRSTRLGKNGVVEIKSHPFFVNHNEWTWETLRKGKTNA